MPTARNRIYVYVSMQVSNTLKHILPSRRHGCLQSDEFCSRSKLNSTPISVRLHRCGEWSPTQRSPKCTGILQHNRGKNRSPYLVPSLMTCGMQHRTAIGSADGIRGYDEAS